MKLAATVIVCRELPPNLQGNYDYEVLLCKRRKEARFMPSYHVFPGGIVEDSDYIPPTDAIFQNLSNELTQNDEMRALKFAAIREVFEESNIFLYEINCENPPTEEEIAFWRQKVLNDPKEFKSMFEALKLKVPMNDLYVWSHWVTPEFEKYRYDTHFFIAHIPYDRSLSSSHDQKEIVDHEWFSPDKALERYKQSNMKLAPPTWMSIGDLARYHTFQSLLHDIKLGRDISCNPIMPKFEQEGDVLTMFLPGDAKSDSPLGPNVKYRIIMPRSNSGEHLSYSIVRENCDSQPRSKL